MSQVHAAQRDCPTTSVTPTHLREFSFLTVCWVGVRGWDRTRGSCCSLDPGDPKTLFGPAWFLSFPVRSPLGAAGQGPRSSCHGHGPPPAAEGTAASGCFCGGPGPGPGRPPCTWRWGRSRAAERGHRQALQATPRRIGVAALCAGVGGPDPSGRWQRPRPARLFFKKTHTLTHFYQTHTHSVLKGLESLCHLSGEAAAFPPAPCVPSRGRTLETLRMFWGFFRGGR